MCGLRCLKLGGGPTAYRTRSVSNSSLARENLLFASIRRTSGSMRSASRIQRRRMTSGPSLARRRLPFQLSLCYRSRRASRQSLLLRRGIDRESRSSGRSGMCLQPCRLYGRFYGRELDAPTSTDNEVSSPPSALTAYPARKESCHSHRQTAFGNVRVLALKQIPDPTTTIRRHTTQNADYTRISCIGVR
jgi:hypothetical protein